MYDPKIARFLQEDTYRGNSNDPLSLNLYTYCANNPMVYYDPTGHNLASLWDNLKTGFNTLFQKSEEERQNDFDLIYEYGNKDGYTKAITNVGGGLSAVGDLWNDPVKQMEENNEILFNSVKNKSNLYKYESLCIYGIETIKGTIQLGKTIGDTFGNADLAMIYDDKDYKIELSQNVETLKSIPGDMLNGIIDNAKTLVNLEKAYDFFINPDATLANNVEYMSAGISTGMTVYGGAKSLQSGHQFLKGIHINTGNMSAGMSGFSASAAMSSGISISVEAGVTASAQSAVQMGMLYASTGFSGNEGTPKTINASDLKMSKTVQNHINDIVKKGPYKGELARPYIDSNGTTLLIDEIMQAGTPVKDTVLKNGLRWDVQGTFRGSTGTWELVVDTSTNTIVHFNFVAK